MDTSGAAALRRRYSQNTKPWADCSPTPTDGLIFTHSRRMQSYSPDKWEASAYTHVWVRRGEISRKILAERWKHKERGWKKGWTFEKWWRCVQFVSSDSAWSCTGGRVWHFALRGVARQPFCCEVHQTLLLLTLSNSIRKDEGMKKKEESKPGGEWEYVGQIRRYTMVEEWKNGYTVRRHALGLSILGRLEIPHSRWSFNHPGWGEDRARPLRQASRSSCKWQQWMELSTERRTMGRKGNCHHRRERKSGNCAKRVERNGTMRWMWEIPFTIY